MVVESKTVTDYQNLSASLQNFGKYDSFPKVILLLLLIISEKIGKNFENRQKLQQKRHMTFSSRTEGERSVLAVCLSAVEHHSRFYLSKFIVVKK